MKEITIVIPCRENENPYTTLESLSKQSFTDFDVVVVYDKDGNANMARNKGFEYVKTPYVLFSDNDIIWEPGAIQALYETLQETTAAYSYGSYELAGEMHCDKAFDKITLRKYNYISTMSLIRTKHFPGFDPEIERLQDWDLWLTMLNKGHEGVYIGEKAFSTPIRDGITKNNKLSWDQAAKIVKKKHDKNPFRAQKNIYRRNR